METPTPVAPCALLRVAQSLALLAFAGGCSTESGTSDPEVTASEGELLDSGADQTQAAPAVEADTEADVEGPGSNAVEADSPESAQTEQPPNWEELGQVILEQVAELRGLDVLEPIPIESADADAARDYTLERLFSLSSEDEVRAQGRVAKLLGLLDPDVDLLELIVSFVQDQAGGFYDPVRGQIFVLPGFSGSLARAVLAHELTHALDDQRYSLQDSMAARAGDADALAAFHAIMEGSAMLVQDKWSRNHLTPEQLLEVAMESEAQSAELYAAPAFLWRPLLCSYLQGSAFLKRAPDLRRSIGFTADPVDVARAFSNPPRSTEQILHPSKYWDDELLDEPRAVGLDPIPDSGWVLVHEDGLGELGLSELFLDGSAPPAGGMLAMRFTHPASEGWDGDRFGLFEREGGDYLVGHIVFDDEAQAIEFAEAFESNTRAVIEGAARTVGDETGGVRLERNGSQVTMEVWSMESALPESSADVVSFQVS